jgi:hypothetical protein
MNDTEPVSESQRVVDELNRRAEKLEREASSLRFRHQFYTVTTILLGVLAPATVSYEPPPGVLTWQWKIIAIVITATATAAATIRTVLRFSERYSNASLTSIALLGLKNQLQAKLEDVNTTVKPEYLRQKQYEVVSWGRSQMFEIVKAHVEKDVSAITRDTISIVPPPTVDSSQLIDKTRQ